MMSRENREGYNGWSNYATWNLKLWLDQDGSTESWVEDLKADNHDDARYEVQERLKQFVEESVENLFDAGSFGFLNDILNNGIAGINYYEIAEAILEENNITFEEE